MPTPKKLASQKAWEQANIRRITVKINTKSEKEMADWLEEKPNKQGYVKSLIEADMNASKQTAANVDSEEK